MPGLLRGVARTAVIAGTATTVSNRVSRRQGQRWAQQEEQQQAPAPPAAPPPPPAGGQSTIDQLKELGELKAQGILTEEEFAAQKAKLLERLSGAPLRRLLQHREDVAGRVLEPGDRGTRPAGDPLLVLLEALVALELDPLGAEPSTAASTSSTSKLRIV